MEKEINTIKKKIEKTYNEVSSLLVKKEFDKVDDMEIQLKKDLTRLTNTYSKKYNIDKNVLSQIIFAIAVIKREETYLNSVKEII